MECYPYTHNQFIDFNFLNAFLFEILYNLVNFLKIKSKIDRQKIAKILTFFSKKLPKILIFWKKSKFLAISLKKCQVFGNILTFKLLRSHWYNICYVWMKYTKHYIYLISTSLADFESNLIRALCLWQGMRYKIKTTAENRGFHQLTSWKWSPSYQ